MVIWAILITAIVSGGAAWCIAYKKGYKKGYKEATWRSIDLC